MGLLDDAIREHLDLKRRRGADPAEVERAEQEALGPVRRNRDSGEAPEIEEPMPAGGGFAYDQDDDLEWAREAPQDEDWSHEPAGGSDRAGTHDEFADDLVEERPVERERTDWSARDDELAAEPFATSSGAPRGSADLSDETAQYDVEGGLGPAEHERDEDMLEETPEFLQDTPDHDRLWFEQRPPRDFDFDE